MSKFTVLVPDIPPPPPIEYQITLNREELSQIQRLLGALCSVELWRYSGGTTLGTLLPYDTEGANIRKVTGPLYTMICDKVGH
jgi:hypothetical protein